jgi:hypothetical protein
MADWSAAVRQRKRLGTSLGEITVTEMGDLITIKQTRVHSDQTRSSPYIVSLTLDEARQVVENLSKRIALADELQRTGLA